MRTLSLAILLGACRPDAGLEVVSAEEVDVLEQSPLIEGRDGGPSARIFGVSVWSYGDTVLTVPDSWGRTWHHNSFSTTADTDASEGIAGFVEPLDPAGAPRHLIPPTPAEKAFNEAHWDDGGCAEKPCGARWAVWPGRPVWDEAGGRGLVSYALIYAEPGDFNFESVGESFAVWAALDATPERVIVAPGRAHPELLWTTKSPWTFAGAPQKVDGELYSFALDDPGFGHPVRLARVPLDRVFEVDAWRYWDGRRWSADPHDAAKLFEGAPILEVSYNDWLGRWMAIYSAPFDHEVVARTAPELTGPWSREVVLYTAPETDPPYDVVHHAEFEEGGGRVQYLTYNRGTRGWFGTEFPIVRVELGR